MKSSFRFLLGLVLAAGMAFSPASRAADAAAGPRKKVIFFSKSSGFEHSVIKRNAGNPSFAEQVLKELGEKHAIEFTFSKDGSLFSKEYLAPFDALFFYTTGDLTEAGTDKHPPMTKEGKAAFFKAIEGGKGFVATHSAADTFHSPKYVQGGARAWESDGNNADPYIKLVGAEFIKHDAQQKARQVVVDAKFPGMEAVPADFGPNEEWYSLKNFAGDMHVLLVQETKDMVGPSYQRPPYPSTWARMHGKGRVFYTSMGHREDVWSSSVFQSVLMGGLNWALGRVKADVSPNFAKAAPQGNVLPAYVAPPPPKQKKAADSVRAATDEYPPHRDSVVQDGVPKGELLQFEFGESKIFPGTTRDVTVYVPRQYDGTKPACVYVNQDGVQYNAPVVFDNLIARGELPVIIGVFVRPGVAKSATAASALDRFNRSYEYDGLGDSYARFLVEELLPAVEKRSTGDGRAIRLSKSGNDRAIGGSSSGAIAAFTAAWERPDAFSRVFSTVGTYVGLRGGDRYPTLIRKYEPKPLRIFLQDGSNDNNIYAGDWWMANQTMERALAFSGYEVQHAWGEGAHNGKHGTSLFPDAIRWLWKDWPQPVKSAASTKNAVLAALLIPGEEWQLVGAGYQFTEGPAVNARGEVFFNDLRASKTYQVSLDGKVSEILGDSKKANGQHFGPDGRRYVVATAGQQILAYDAGGKATQPADGIAGNDLVVAHNGNVYVTHPPAGTSNDPSKIWLIKPDGMKLTVDTGVRYANGITLSPDQSLLYVADFRSHWVYSYQIKADGTLANKQRYYWLHEADADDQSNADGIRCDRDGRLYVATRLGIQVCDQAGRVNAIIPTPNGRVANIVFGGGKFDTLFAMCGDKVYKRKLSAIGANGWDAPNKPPTPRL